MNTNSTITPEWSSSAGKAFWGVILTSFAGIISTVYDYVAFIVGFIEYASETLSKMLNEFGGGDSLPSIAIEELVGIGFSSKALVVIGYILYLWGLTSFAKIQRIETTAMNVRKARSATILLIVTFLLDIVFGVLSIIPFASIFFGIITWIMFMVCFYMMKHAFAELMTAQDFSPRSQRGARNLRYAACCEIRLKWLPIVTGLIVLFIILTAVMVLTSKQSLEGMEGLFKAVAGAIVLVLIVAGIMALFAMFCAFWWPIIGWYRIKTGGAAVMTDASAQDALEGNVAADAISAPDVPAGTETMLQEAETLSSANSWTEKITADKKNLYIGGGVLGAIVVCATLWFGLKGCSDDNIKIELLQAQPMFWNKFVSPKSTPTAIYEQPDISHVLDRTAEGTILPVVDETLNFYKIYIGGGREAWAKKNQWKEVMFEPIKPELLPDIFLNGQRLSSRIRTFIDGDLANLTLCYYRDFSSEGHLEIAILDNGRLIRPSHSHFKAVPLDGRGFTVVAATDSEDPKIEFGTNYQTEGDENVEGFLDTHKLSKKQIAEIWKAAQGEKPNMVTVSYYFPSLETVRFYDIDLNMYGSETKKLQGQVTEGNAGLTGFSYEAVGGYNSDMGTTAYSLYAVRPSGDKINTEIAGYSQELLILAQDDYDGDGEKEAVVYEWGGGNSIQPPYIVYYDQDEEMFKKVEGFDYVSEQPEISVEQWNDKPSFITKVGLRKDRYIYEGHTIKLVESVTPDLGERVATIPLSQVFKESDGDMDRSIYIDIDGDGSTELLSFHHDDSHAMNWGNSMMLVSIEADNWKIPTDTNVSLGVTGKTFSFLITKNNGIPDILCDDAWLYCWDGEKFVLKE